MYIPTSSAKETTSFYDLLQKVTNEQSDAACLIVMRDCNAKVGADWQQAGAAIGKFGVHSLNDAREHLTTSANINRLVVELTDFGLGSRQMG